MNAGAQKWSRGDYICLASIVDYTTVTHIYGLTLLPALTRVAPPQPAGQLEERHVSSTATTCHPGGSGFAVGRHSTAETSTARLYSAAVPDLAAIPSGRHLPPVFTPRLASISLPARSAIMSGNAFLPEPASLLPTHTLTRLTQAPIMSAGFDSAAHYATGFDHAARVNTHPGLNQSPATFLPPAAINVRARPAQVPGGLYTHPAAHPKAAHPGQHPSAVPSQNQPPGGPHIYVSSAIGHSTPNPHGPAVAPEIDAIARSLPSPSGAPVDVIYVRHPSEIESAEARRGNILSLQHQRQLVQRDRDRAIRAQSFSRLDASLHRLGRRLTDQVAKYESALAHMITQDAALDRSLPNSALLPPSVPFQFHAPPPAAAASPAFPVAPQTASWHSFLCREVGELSPSPSAPQPSPRKVDNTEHDVRGQPAGPLGSNDELDKPDKFDELDELLNESDESDEAGGYIREEKCKRGHADQASWVAADLKNFVKYRPAYQSYCEEKDKEELSGWLRVDNKITFSHLCGHAWCKSSFHIGLERLSINVGREACFREADAALRRVDGDISKSPERCQVHDGPCLLRERCAAPHWCLSNEYLCAGNISVDDLTEIQAGFPFAANMVLFHSARGQTSDWGEIPSLATNLNSGITFTKEDHDVLFGDPVFAEGSHYNQAGDFLNIVPGIKHFEAGDPFGDWPQLATLRVSRNPWKATFSLCSGFFSAVSTPAASSQTTSSSAWRAPYVALYPRRQYFASAENIHANRRKHVPPSSAMKAQDPVAKHVKGEYVFVLQ
ncbi:hypothetical protein JX265_004348 [Neoarthrinium moseri]|uniref:Uncharacterized protein n=1 Tax=Neoarthrinium moseri TaxID=1658444 RepID=A0A9Q0ANN7_9PEZI|nr:hypothetical protein JX265_004348 [Neoarthrinium moseri]